jgi:hypothetical protein
MGLADVMLPLVLFSLAYFLLFAVAPSRGTEEIASRHPQR